MLSFVRSALPNALSDCEFRYCYDNKRARVPWDCSIEVDLCRQSGLTDIVLNSSSDESDENVSVGGNLHLTFAHSRAAIAFIS